MEGSRIAVLGAGNMGRALLRGMLKADWASADTLVATTRRADTASTLAKEMGIEAHTDNLRAVRDADVIILAVKPQILGDVLAKVAPGITKGKLVISIAAGVTCASMSRVLPEGVAVIRAMPNLPVTVDAGATAVALGAHASADDAAKARAIFESVGIVVEVDEYQMDAVTGLSGTGPMYVFQFIEGLADAGVKVGLSRETATALVLQTMLGSAKLAIASGEHPGRLKDRVTSPGGTAITALHVLEKGGIRAILMDAVEAATKRAEELGRKADAKK